MTLIQLLVLIAVVGLILWLFNSVVPNRTAKVVANVVVVLVLIVLLIDVFDLTAFFNQRL